MNDELHEDKLAQRDADCLLMGETLETLQKAITSEFGGRRMIKALKPGPYKHYKRGDDYTVIDIAYHSETKPRSLPC